MHRLLLALLGLVGAGVSVASPVTYSEAGRTTVASMLTLDGPRVETAITREAQCSGTGSDAFAWVDVGWATEENVLYSGRWRNHCNREFVRDNMERFYEGYCETTIRAHCGRLKRGNRPFEAETDALTGTSVDEWWEWEPLEPPIWEFGPGGSGAGPGAQGVEFSCATLNSRYEWSSRQFPNPNDPPDGVIYAIARYDGVVWSSVSSGSTAAPRVLAAANDIAARCKVPDTIRKWREGDYWQRQYGPDVPYTTPNDDVAEGLRIIWAELLAENDRTGVEGLSIAGMRFDPLPTPEQLNLGEGVPGEGGGTEVDPGTCEEGWFLTRVVCEIRDAMNTLWQFISHDAWVPQEDWGVKFGELQDSTQTRFPFSMFVSAHTTMTWLQGWNRSQSEALMCAPIEVKVVNPFPGDETPLVDGVDLCDNAFAEFMHDYGRPMLILVVGLMMSFSLIQRISGTLS